MKQNGIDQNKKALLNFFETLKSEIEVDKNVLSLRPKLIVDLNCNFSGDFDFVIREKHFPATFEVIYNLCKELGVNFILNQQAQNKKLFKFFIRESDNVFLMLEFWTVVEVTAKDGTLNSFDANTIINTIKNKTLTANEVFSLLFITHLFHKNKNIKTDENTFRFDSFFDDIQNEDASSKDGKTFSLLSRLKNDKILLKDANREAIDILAIAGFRNSRKFSDKLSYFNLRVRNKILNLKKIVPIIGPDGVGKGAVSEAALSSLDKWAPFPFKMLYRIKAIYRLRLNLLNNLNDKPMNQSDEEIGYFIYLMAWIMIRVVKVFKPKKNILLDRYFLDYLGTPIRYLKENQVPKKLNNYNLLLWLMPVPNTIIFLGCKSESLILRKNELPIVSVDFLQHLYCDFIIKKRPPVTLFVSTENNVDISGQAVQSILNKI